MHGAKRQSQRSTCSYGSNNTISESDSLTSKSGTSISRQGKSSIQRSLPVHSRSNQRGGASNRRDTFSKRRDSRSNSKRSFFRSSSPENDIRRGGFPIEALSARTSRLTIGDTDTTSHGRSSGVHRSSPRDSVDSRRINDVDQRDADDRGSEGPSEDSVSDYRFSASKSFGECTRGSCSSSEDDKDERQSLFSESLSFSSIKSRFSSATVHDVAGDVSTNDSHPDEIINIEPGKRVVIPKQCVVGTEVGGVLIFKHRGERFVLATSRFFRKTLEEIENSKSKSTTKSLEKNEEESKSYGAPLLKDEKLKSFLSGELTTALDILRPLERRHVPVLSLRHHLQLFLIRYNAPPFYISHGGNVREANRILILGLVAGIFFLVLGFFLILVALIAAEDRHAMNNPTRFNSNQFLGYSPNPYNVGSPPSMKMPGMVASPQAPTPVRVVPRGSAPAGVSPPGFVPGALASPPMASNIISRTYPSGGNTTVKEDTRRESAMDTMPLTAVCFFLAVYSLCSAYYNWKLLKKIQKFDKRFSKFPAHIVDMESLAASGRSPQKKSLETEGQILSSSRDTAKPPMHDNIHLDLDQPVWTSAQMKDLSNANLLNGYNDYIERQCTSFVRGASERQSPVETPREKESSGSPSIATWSILASRVNPNGPASSKSSATQSEKSFKKPKREKSGSRSELAANRIDSPTNQVTSAVNFVLSFRTHDSDKKDQDRDARGRTTFRRSFPGSFSRSASAVATAVRRVSSRFGKRIKSRISDVLSREASPVKKAKAAVNWWLK